MNGQRGEDWTRPMSYHIILFVKNTKPKLMGTKCESHIQEVFRQIMTQGGVFI